MKRENKRDLDTDVQGGRNDLVAQLEVHKEGLDKVESVAGDVNGNVGMDSTVPKDREHGAQQADSKQQNKQIEYTPV